MKYITTTDPKTNEGLVVSFDETDNKILDVVDEDGNDFEIDENLKKEIQSQIDIEMENLMLGNDHDIIDGSQNHVVWELESLIGEDDYALELPDFALDAEILVLYDEDRRLLDVSWNDAPSEKFPLSDSLKKCIQSKLDKL